MCNEVLDFWFKEIEPKNWFVASDEFDETIKRRFLACLQQAQAGELFSWRLTAQGRLAEIIVLDQFSRNVFRNTPAAFSQDSMALVLAQEAVSAGALTVLNESERTFLLMPYMHSESAAIHQHAECLFKDFGEANSYEFELKHKVIIDRFGRYPHRNLILGRESTDQELLFLTQPNSSF